MHSDAERYSKRGLLRHTANTGKVLSSPGRTTAETRLQSPSFYFSLLGNGDSNDSSASRNDRHSDIGEAAYHERCKRAPPEEPLNYRRRPY